MVRVLLAASLAWPMLATAAVWQRHEGHAPVWTSAVYAGASVVCHQRRERSMTTAGVPWPVCARCSGLYLAAPFGVLLALTRSPRPLRPGRARLLFAVAAVPTAITLGVEWLGWSALSNGIRLAAAFPAGAAVAFLVARVAGSRDPI